MIPEWLLETTDSTLKEFTVDPLRRECLILAAISPNQIPAITGNFQIFRLSGDIVPPRLRELILREPVIKI